MTASDVLPSYSRIHTCHRLTLGISWTAISVGALALVGWWLGIPVTTSIFTDLATMKPITAITFAFTGAALWMALRPPISARRRSIVQTLASIGALIVVIGLLRLQAQPA
jgi:hypothetical protein